MARYLAVRLYSMALTLAGLTVLTFLMLRLIPGTVVEQMIGADAIVSPAMVAELCAAAGEPEARMVSSPCAARLTPLRHNRSVGIRAINLFAPSFRDGPHA